jgi:hypothetical protein
LIRIEHQKLEERGNLRHNNGIGHEEEQVINESENKVYRGIHIFSSVTSYHPIDYHDESMKGIE